MEFTNLITYIEKSVHGIPEDIKKEWVIAKKILTRGKGYLTKTKPVKIIFYDDHAVK